MSDKELSDDELRAKVAELEKATKQADEETTRAKSEDFKKAAIERAANAHAEKVAAEKAAAEKAAAAKSVSEKAAVLAHAEKAAQEAARAKVVAEEQAANGTLAQPQPGKDATAGLQRFGAMAGHDDISVSDTLFTAVRYKTRDGHDDYEIAIPIHNIAAVGINIHRETSAVVLSFIAGIVLGIFLGYWMGTTFESSVDNGTVLIGFLLPPLLLLIWSLKRFRVAMVQVFFNGTNYEIKGGGSDVQSLHAVYDALNARIAAREA